MAKRDGVVLSAAQSQYVLERALADRKLNAADVRGYLGEMHEEISRLQERLATLQSLVVEPVKHAAAALATKVRAPRKARPKKAGTASQQVQGQYLGFLRQIPKKDRAKYQSIAREKSREDAIAAMKKALGK